MAERDEAASLSRRMMMQAVAGVVGGLVVSSVKPMAAEALAGRDSSTTQAFIPENEYPYFGYVPCVADLSFPHKP